MRSMLFSFRFHEDTVELVMSCISSTSASLLVNGSQLESFKPSRGLRQGDPISPYIFILCMEFLSSLINKKCEEVKWIKVKASRGGLEFSHSFFVDDLLLYAKADRGNCEPIVDVLEEFCELTGQKISKVKSKVFFSPNTPEETKDDLVQLLEINKTSNLGKYLGFPILHKGRRRNDFQSVVERVQAKLAGWKNKCLSPAGRIMLIKAAVIAIPEYTMQCYRIPVRICDEVDKLVRDFLWGSTMERKKMHMVGWSHVTMPQDLRGLGIFQMKAQNFALLAKLCWGIASSQNYPWAQILISKYLTATRLSEGGRKLPTSKIWAACKEGGIIFNKGLKWVVANGEEVGFGDDFWLTSGPLRKQIEGLLAEGENNLSVKMFLSNPNELSFNFPETILKDIQGIPLASCPELKYRLI